MSAPKNRKAAEISADFSALAAFLRRACPNATVKTVAQLAGVPVATADNWLQLRAKPSGSHLLALAAAFGPAVLAACYGAPPDWITEAVKAQRLAALDAQIRELERQRHEAA